MRVIITGDKSRYQFLRFLVNEENLKINDNLYTERMSDIDVFVSSDKTADEACTYYSSNVPLNSLVYFPKEYGADSSFSDDDKVLFFNEFPYNREEDVESLNDIANSGKYGQICVVLVYNGRTGIDTDISSDDMAILSAEKMLDDMGLSHCKYTMGSVPDFLYWKIAKQEKYEKNLLMPLLKKTKYELDVFDSTYDLLYELDVAMIVDDPTIRKLILKYDSSLNNKNVWTEYASRLILRLIKGEKSVKDFYIELYKKIVSAISIWDINKDTARLTDIVENALKEKFSKYEELIFRGNEDDYETFLNNNKVIYLLSQGLISFFKEDLKTILKKRIIKDIEIMEGFLDECNC